VIYSPEEGWALYKVKPKARFINFASDSSAVDFYSHCEIVDINDSTFTYHDSILVSDPLEPWVSNWEPHFVDVTFAEWTAPSISDFRATFYTTEAGNGQPMFVDFRWTGIEEQPPTTPHPTFSVVTGLGSSIKLRYLHPSASSTLTIAIYDALGRLADEVVLDGPGTVTWGEGQSTGVYFIVPQEGTQPAQKVILVR
jgi:hypothetical protein